MLTISVQQWLEATDFYRDYLSNCPAPFNNIYFDSILFIFLVIYAMYRFLDALRMERRHMEIKNRQIALADRHAAAEEATLRREEESLMHARQMDQMIELISVNILNGQNTDRRFDYPEIPAGEEDPARMEEILEQLELVKKEKEALIR